MKRAGFYCAGCGSGRFQVLATRPSFGVVRRYRKCRDCGKKLTTVETTLGGTRIPPISAH